MASAPQPQLPLFYKDLLPLNSRDHAGWKAGTLESAAYLAATHAIPLTSDEFVDAQRDFPIVFTAGENPLPIALFGLNEGVNTFVGDDMKINEAIYLPAYARRYPFILAKLQPNSDDMSLCFDPSAGLLGNFPEGLALFDEAGQATEYTQGVLEFCRRFEEAGQRTKLFMDELVKLDILIDGEIAITRNDMPDKPFIYRGFRMVDENKLRELPAETLEGLVKNGILALIYAHLYSLNLMRNLFERQTAQGKVPVPGEAAPALN
ncbi:SapC family protein [Erythrobacter sp. BLCC-B19]|uniref:SapC family protein n=1 Tax=Erythrobacter sp. BLCC-B19 TaxID=3025315 RepID=UPI0023617BBC|nr:SapC family protein [Erythrobacter sp. BLCC-B19]WDA40370.1 SapC family protein [Erythrobacter sp. BLCC-B19]